MGFNRSMTGTSSSANRYAGITRYALAVAVCMTLAVVLAGCDRSGGLERIDLSDRIDNADLHKVAVHQDSDVFLFGFDLRSTPEEDAKQYLPFIDYLEKTTGLRFELRFSRKNGLVARDLGTGVIQFAAIGADTYIEAHAKYGVIPIVRGLNAEGRAEYQSVIVTGPKSSITSVEQLRGKRFAFGSVTSTQGHLIPRIVLAEHGLSFGDLSKHGFTGSHYNCAKSVAAGQYDAGGMQDIMGRRLAEEGLIRIIYTSKFYPSSGIAANRNVPPEVINKVKQALLDFDPTGKDATGLYHWDQTEMAGGFIEARDEDYAELRDWSVKLGLLDDYPEGDVK